MVDNGPLAARGHGPVDGAGRALVLHLKSGGGGADVATYAPQLAGASEAAMTFGELYKRNNEWKFRAVGQGFKGGLGPLAAHFGVNVG